MLSFFIKYIFFLTIFLSQIFSNDLIEDLSIHHNQLLSIFTNIQEDVYDYEFAIEYIIENDLSNVFNYSLGEFNIIFTMAINSPDVFLNIDKNSLKKYKYDSEYFTNLKKKISNKQKSHIINTFTIEDINESSTELIATPYDFFKDRLVLSINYGPSFKFGIGDDYQKYDNGSFFDISIYHPDTIEIFQKTYLIAFNLKTISVPSESSPSIWNYDTNSFNIHLINYLKKIPIKLDFSMGIANNKKYDVGFLFESSLSYELEFNPINLSFDLGYTKYIDITDDNSLDFETLDLIGFNIKLTKKIQLN